MRSRSIEEKNSTCYKSTSKTVDTQIPSLVAQLQQLRRAPHSRHFRRIIFCHLTQKLFYEYRDRVSKTTMIQAPIKYSNINEAKRFQTRKLEPALIIQPDLPGCSLVTNPELLPLKSQVIKVTATSSKCQQLASQIRLKFENHRVAKLLVHASTLCKLSKKDQVRFLGLGRHQRMTTSVLIHAKGSDFISAHRSSVINVSVMVYIAWY